MKAFALTGLIFALAFLLGASSCPGIDAGGDNSSSNNGPTPGDVNVVGTWSGTYTITYASIPQATGTIQWDLTSQSDQSGVQGTYTGDVLPVTSGQVNLYSSNGSFMFNLGFSCTNPGETSAFTGNYQLSGTTLTGSAPAQQGTCEQAGDNPQGITSITFSVTKQ